MLSAPELFRSLHLVYGTIYQTVLHLLSHYTLSGTISRPFFFNDPFRTSFWHLSGPCNSFAYLGHYKKL